MIRVYYSATTWYEGKDYTEVLESMMADDWNDYENVQQFIQVLRKRVAAALDMILPVQDTKAIIDTLYDIGMIVRIEIDGEERK